MIDRYFEVYPPDNPMFIPLSAIVYVARDGEGCVIRTADGTSHFFRSMSYDDMKTKLTGPPSCRPIGVKSAAVSEHQTENPRKPS